MAANGAPIPRLNPRSELDRIRHASLALVTDVQTIWELAQAAHEWQWQGPPRYVDPLETGDVRRPENVHADPTGDAAVAPERIYLRHEFRRTASTLDHAARLVRGRVVAIDRARTVWRGW